MDDFQHRLLVALERLAGGEGPSLGEDMSALILRLEVIEARLAALIVVQEAILAKMPGHP
jgi:hypothetical protein